jgi:hypothetical protein
MAYGICARMQTNRQDFHANWYKYYTTGVHQTFILLSVLNIDNTNLYVTRISEIEETTALLQGPENLCDE